MYTQAHISRLICTQWINTNLTKIIRSSLDGAQNVASGRLSGGKAFFVVRMVFTFVCNEERHFLVSVSIRLWLWALPRTLCEPKHCPLKLCIVLLWKTLFAGQNVFNTFTAWTFEFLSLFLSALISKYSTSSRCVYFFFVSSVTLCVELSLRSFIFFLCVMKCVLLSMKMVCVYTDVSRTHTRTHLPNTKYVIRQCRTILVYGIGHLSMHVTVCVSILSECFFLLSSECRARCNLIGSKVKAEFSSDINYNVCE